MRKTIRWITSFLATDSNSALHYDLRGEAALLQTHHGVPTMNFGYWDGIDPNSRSALWDATESLFAQVASMAEFARGDRVLDAGCGFGTNLRYCAENFSLEQAVGLNVSESQLRRCRALAAEAQCDTTPEFVLGSATEMPFDDGQFDKVVSVEAAFHFPPRADFFREAARVLKPGGVLAMTDLVATPPANLMRSLQLRVLRRAIQVPADNVYGLDVYRKHLTEAGFTVDVLRSIRPQVIPRYRQWLSTRSVAELCSVHPALMLASGSFYTYPWDYILLRARKPLHHN